MKNLKKSLLFLAGLSLFFTCPGIAEIIVSQPDVRQYNLGLGKKVFLNKCLKCHSDIDSDAPQLHNTDDWEQRINSPLDTLIGHAINGHGKMPPKGGYKKLTEREISAAVAYVVDQSRRLLFSTNGNIALNQNEICTGSNSKECNSMQIDNTMLLQLIWLMTNKPQE